MSEKDGFLELQAANSALENAEVLMWVYLHKVLDQRVRMTDPWIDGSRPMLSPRDVEKVLRELGRRPPETRDSYRVLSSVRAMWESRLDHQTDRWREARIRFQRAYQRYTGNNFRKAMNEIATEAAPLTKEILEDDPSPAVPAWVHSRLKRMSKHGAEMPPVDTTQ